MRVFKAKNGHVVYNGNNPSLKKSLGESLTKKQAINVTKKNQPELQSSSDYVLQLKGFDYNGVNVSATRDDQNGLTAVFVGFSSGFIKQTNFRFSNGAKLLINESNLQDFAKKWTSFRQKFFTEAK